MTKTETKQQITGELLILPANSHHPMAHHTPTSKESLGFVYGCRLNNSLPQSGSHSGSVQGMHSDGALLSRLCIWNEALRVVNEEGVRAFWKGNMVTIARRLSYVVVNFYAYQLTFNHLSSMLSLSTPP
ncbi:putative mitochondrial carrier domain superfamily [Helianthus anomalus]